MSERGRSRPGSRPGGSRPFRAQKQATPTWIVVAFIGVPSLIILILAGMLVARCAGSKPVEEEPVKSGNEMAREADTLYSKALDMKKKAKTYSSEGQPVERWGPLLKQAMMDLRAAQQKYSEILQEAERQGEDTESEDYGYYKNRLTEIQVHLRDVVNMMPMGL